MAFGAQLPQPGVGLVELLPCALADRLECFEILDPADPQQAMIEKSLRVRQDDLPISVVLDLLIGLVADAHRAHPAITVECGRLTLDQRRLAADTVERLNVAPRRIVDDVAQIFEIAFEHVERAEPVERLHGVISVANPAVAIVPVAPRSGMFRNRRRQRRDDRAGLLLMGIF